MGRVHADQDFEEDRQRADATLLAVLRESLAASPRGIETFLVTQFGQPFASSNSFGNWFDRRVAMAIGRLGGTENVRPIPNPVAGVGKKTE